MAKRRFLLHIKRKFRTFAVEIKRKELVNVSRETILQNQLKLKHYEKEW